MTSRPFAISILSLAVLILCWPTVSSIASLGLHDDRYVQITAAPLLFLFLMYWDRDRIFAGAEWNPRLGIVLLGLSLGAYFIFLRRPSPDEDGTRLILAVVTIIVSWIAAFILCYGLQCFRAASFPFCCLLLMIPVPGSIMDRFLVALQHSSAAVSYRLLRMAGIPVFAEGTKLSLPGLRIEVAPECSGIHSCLALALLGVVAGRVYLQYGWNRWVLVLATIPIAIFKNAVRISVIASLGAYVDRAFLFGRIHHYGGLVFGPLGVALFLALLVGMQRGESWFGRRKVAAPGSGHQGDGTKAVA